MPLSPANITKAREAAGMSKLDAARACGWHAPTWHQFEAGERPNPTLDTLETVARALRCCVQDLLAGGQAVSSRASS